VAIIRNIGNFIIVIIKVFFHRKESVVPHVVHATIGVMITKVCRGPVPVCKSGAEIIAVKDPVVIVIEVLANISATISIPIRN
jgi:hypothetical protein